MAEKSLDRDIRESLHTYLRKGLAVSDEVAVINELVLQRKDGRADVAVVSDHLHCYEIKSDADNLDRLHRQVRVYSRVFDYLSVVTTNRHYAHALKAVPSTWGAYIWQPRAAAGGAATIEQLRAPTLNEATQLTALTQMLWLDTALDLLREVNGAKGLSTKPKWFLWSRVQELCTQEQIHRAVVQQLKKHRRTESRAWG